MSLLPLPSDPNRVERHPRPRDIADLFRITGAVGPEAANARDDVIRAQILLGQTGDLDLDSLGGPTGWPGGELTRGLKRYQRRKGLTADGLMLPDGETINALQEDLYDRLARYKAPTTAEVDDHHDKLARYRADESENALPPRTALAMPGSGLPAYVRALAENTNQRRAEPQPLSAVMSDVDGDASLGFMPGAQVAQAALPVNPAMAAPVAGSAGASQQLPPGVTPEMAKAGQQLETWFDEKVNLLRLPVQTYHALSKGEASAPPSEPLDPATDSATKTPPLQPSAPEEPKEYSGDLLAWGTRAIQAGIRDIFDTTVERHETDNTRLSSNVIVQACNEVIGENIRLYGFEHVAGASLDGKGEKEVSEAAMKDGAMNKGGGGHSFPDVLYKRGEELVGINSATESAPGRYIGREVRSFAKLVENMGRWVAAITGKKRPDEDIEEYRERARQVCEEAFGKHLAKEDSEAEQQTDKSSPVSP